MDLIKEAKNYVKELFLNNKNELLLFHNLGYINKTVSYANQLCDIEKVGKEDRENILVSAWLFSTGFLFDYIDFKKQSIRVAHEFLKEQKVGAEKSEAILMIIETVLHNKQHDSICGEILYDASEFYVAIDEFLLWVKYHRQERNYFLKPKLTKRSFWQTVENYLHEHEFSLLRVKVYLPQEKPKILEK